MKATVPRVHESHNGALGFWEHTPSATAPGQESGLAGELGSWKLKEIWQESFFPFQERL